MSILMLLIFVVALALVVALYAVIGVFVYRDARRRGMNAALWTLVVILVPSFIGLIIYLLARNSMPEGNQCANCGAPVIETFLACPKCGAELAAPCPSCGKQVSREWKLCPYCKAELPAPQQVLKHANRMHPALIAVIIALVVLVFAALAVTLIYLPMINYSNSSGISIASVRSSSESRMSGSFAYKNGTETKVLHLDNGQNLTVAIDIAAESGSIAAEIISPSGEQLNVVANDYNGILAVGADETGDYVIKLTMSQCKGRYDVSWTIK